MKLFQIKQNKYCQFLYDYLSLSYAAHICILFQLYTCHTFAATYLLYSLYYIFMPRLLSYVFECMYILFLCQTIVKII